MLQSLLEERFGLKAHRAPKTGNGFALTVAKGGPKLQPAEAKPVETAWQDLTDEQRKARMQQQTQQMDANMQKQMQEYKASGQVSGSSRPYPSITTGELATQLVTYVGEPVVDETGLTGKYSLTLQTAKYADGSETTIYDAVEKLGLKLSPRKSITVENLLIDQVSKIPTEN